GIKSVRSRVGNVNEFLDEPLDIERFKLLILEKIFGSVEEIEEYELTDEDWDKIMTLSKEKYQTDDWNFGKNPHYNFEASHKFDAGLLDVRLEVQKGIIERAAIFGDFFGIGEIKDIEEKLIGVRHDYKSIDEALKGVDIPHYLGRITREEFLELIV
uniref:lipoate--protein ligase n=1 Tax=Nosocomiicoccus massiliensis TaxID=1232430 RepID=UPI0005953CD0